MTQWHFSIDGQQVGPMDQAEAVQYATANPVGYCWRPGFADWIPIADCDELRTQAGPAPAAPPVPVAGYGGERSALSPGVAGADEIDFRIVGQEMQFVEIELDPGESAVAEAGAMMYKDQAVEMSTLFGDGSGQEGNRFLDKLIGAGKRVITGESLFTTMFTHTGQGKAHVAFAAPYPGNILALNLSDYGGRLICQKDSFLCAAKGVQIGIHFQKKILTGLFGGEGFIMQKLEGNGYVFVHMGGTLIERDLAAGETLHVDTGCLAALTETVTYDVVRAGNIKTMLFGGEGVFFATLTGPGHVWLQSLPFARLAGRMLAAGSRGEGSILGPIGDMLDGDNRF